jgi:hypothetical protein
MDLLDSLNVAFLSLRTELGKPVCFISRTLSRGRLKNKMNVRTTMRLLVCKLRKLNEKVKLGLYAEYKL